MLVLRELHRILTKELHLAIRVLHIGVTVGGYRGCSLERFDGLSLTFARQLNLLEAYVLLLHRRVILLILEVITLFLAWFLSNAGSVRATENVVDGAHYIWVRCSLLLVLFLLLIIKHLPSFKFRLLCWSALDRRFWRAFQMPSRESGLSPAPCSTRFWLPLSGAAARRFVPARSGRIPRLEQLSAGSWTGSERASPSKPARPLCICCIESRQPPISSYWGNDVTRYRLYSCLQSFRMW